VKPLAPPAGTIREFQPKSSTRKTCIVADVPFPKFAPTQAGDI
jgi:hypothetical protein